MGWLADTVGNVVGGVAGGISSAWGYNAAVATNEAMAKEAQKNRDFQKFMSNTAHQREVRDLRLSGLNPILSANAGSSTPSGAVAQVINPIDSAFAGVNTGKTVAETIKTSLSSRLIKEEINTQRSIQNLNNANAINTLANTTKAKGSLGYLLGRIVRKSEDDNSVQQFMPQLLRRNVA